MTATELYQQYPEFQQLIESWVSDRQIPIGLVDWLLEREQERLAEIVRGVVDYRATELDAVETSICLYPRCMKGPNGGYKFFYWSITNGDKFAHDLEIEYKDITIHTDREFRTIAFATPALAILAYLDFSLTFETSLHSKS